MPRKQFKMAPDAAQRRIECGHFNFNGGAPFCRALTHPWCLAPGESQLTCRFRTPEPVPVPVPEPVPEPPKTERRSAKKAEAAGDGEAD